MGLEVFDHYECDGKMEIEDIVPERRLTHLSLFSGIGGAGPSCGMGRI